MSKPVNPMAIGGFLIAGLALLITALLVFGGSQLFKPKLRWVVYFDSSLNGLNVGAPVKVQGVQMGTVADIVLQLDPTNNRLVKPVILEIEPGHLVDPRGGRITMALSDSERRKRLEGLIDAGLRARLEIQSLLTGLLYVDLDFYPHRSSRLTGMDYQGLPEVPSIPTTTDEVRNTLEEAVEKFRDLPIDAMVKDLAAAIADIRAILASDQTRQSRDALVKTLMETQKLMAEMNRQLPSVIKDMGVMAKEASQTAKDAGSLVRDLRAETKPVLAAAEKALNKATAVLESVKGATANLTDTTAGDAPLQQSLEELRKAARSVRELSDYLQRNPESLIYGKPDRN